MATVLMPSGMIIPDLSEQNSWRRQNIYLPITYINAALKLASASVLQST